MTQKVQLSIFGFSISQERKGAYGLVMAEENSLRRLLIVIGTPEAQAIAFQLYKSTPPRPLTHDIYSNTLNAFDINLKEVFIYKYENGVFFSQLLFEQDGKSVIIESRTSDAIALAIRTDSPIFTTEEIMQSVGIVIDQSSDKTSTLETKKENDRGLNYELLSKTELETLLDDAIRMEDYELASVLRDEINKRK